MGKYFDELQRSMEYLAQDERTIFLGQAVKYAGTGMTNSFKNIPSEKLIEFPVCEDFQQGVSNGLALAGLIPVSIYPRFDFFILSTNQLINHLDKFKEMGTAPTKVIIRTSIGSVRPLHPHVQHCNDYTEAYRTMLRNVDIIKLEEPEDIFPAYERALTRTDGKSTILVEYGDYLGEK